MSQSRRLLMSVVAAFLTGVFMARAQVEVKSVPAGKIDAATTASWAKAKAGPVSQGVALENQSLLVVVQSGAPVVDVYDKADGAVMRRAGLSLVGGGDGATVGRIEVTGADGDEAAVRIVQGVAEAELSLGAMSRHVTVKPGKGSRALDVQTGVRFTVLPDFFADDTVYDAARITAAKTRIPAENFLIHLTEDGNAMVMCVWQGNLRLKGKGTEAKKADSPDPASQDTAEPKVELLVAGDGAARRLTSSRIEFVSGKAVFVGVLGQKGIWHEEDVASWPACKITPIQWKRPFDARWRGDYMVADGKTIHDFPAKNQSFDFKAITAEDLTRKGPVSPDVWWSKRSSTPERPGVFQGHIDDIILYPSVFRVDETRLCLYADQRVRRAMKIPVKVEPTQYPSNMYERVIIYPLDRAMNTPLTAFLPTDLMRDCIGQGPCEYVLDVSGVGDRPVGGDRKLLDTSTCDLWQFHIEPLVKKLPALKNADGTFKPMEEKDKQHLMQAMDDSWFFVKAVHDRIREYIAWGKDMEAFLAEYKKAPRTKPLAEKALAEVAALQREIAKFNFEGPGSEAYWKTRVPELVEQVKSDRYAETATIGTIRQLGDKMDKLVSRCRQGAKKLRNDMIGFETGDPEVEKLAAEIHARCQQILRNKHLKEGI